MSKIELIRTTAFRLTAEHFGTVHVYRPGEKFARVWGNLERTWRLQDDTADFRQLPYRGLATALRVLTGDFVALNRRAASGQAIVISRQFISPAALQTAIGSWETRALGMPNGPVSRVVSDLHPETVRVADYVSRRPGLCPNLREGWVWDVGIWEAAHRLAATWMRTDRAPVRWRLDSDAALLSWDHVLDVAKTDAAAMHKLTLHLITLPGVEDPVLSIQGSLVRLAPTWKATGGARYAWAELSDSTPLLRARVRNKSDGNGGWMTEWSDRAAEVLHGASLDPLPRIVGEPELSGPIRTGYAKQPRAHRMGKGVGQWFHECVHHHARQALGDSASPVTLSTRKIPTGVTRRSARVPLGLDQPTTELVLRVLVVYADSTIRRRVRDALYKVLTTNAHARDAQALIGIDDKLRALDDGIALRIGPLELCFLKPDGAERYLVARSIPRDIEGWVDTWLPAHTRPGVRLAAIIETNVETSDNRNKKDSLADPKLVLRRYLAHKGVATQFITPDSAPKAKQGKPTTDAKAFHEHAAASAVGDLFRSAGFFLRPFPEFGCGEDTLVVGIYCVRLTRSTTQARTSYVVNLIAVSLGTQDAWGYVDGSGWVPIEQATARFLASDQRKNSESDAKALAERGVDALHSRFGDRRVVLLFDAFGCRRLWPCLTDKSDGQPDLWMTRYGKAVVRVRTATSEIVRAAGAGEWTGELNPAKYTPFRLMKLNGGEGRSPTYVLAGSAVMSREISARQSTRFAADSKNLSKEWHSLGISELQVLEAGPWADEDLLRQVAILCRIAPTWDRTLRWPSPLHLARAVVRNHPHGYFNEGEEAEVEDAKPMRFDLEVYS